MEVIVVDNGSKVNEAAIINQRYPQIKTIRSEQNLGFAGGNNLGINAASGNYLYFICHESHEPTASIHAFYYIGGAKSMGGG